MTVLPGERTLADGADELERRASSRRRSDGVAAGQDLHASSAATTPSACTHEVVNGSAAPVDAAAVPAAGARRQPAGGRIVVLLHLHRPGGLHRGQQVQEDRLQGHREGQRRPSTERPTTAGSRWCSTTSPRPGCCPGNAQREFRTAKVADNLYSVGMVTPLGDVAPGATQGARGHAVRRPAGREQARRAGAGAGPGQGLRLVHDPVQAAVLAADAAARAARQLGLGHRGAGGAAEDRLLLAQRQRLQVDGQDEGHQPAR